MQVHNKKLVSSTLIGLAALALAGTAAAYDQTFLDDYSKLQPVRPGDSTELIYTAPGIFERLSKYDGLVIDQPEILISPDSPYKGGKPDDMAKVAELMRTAANDRFTAGGYRVVDQAGPGIIHVRLGLTDLQLKKKKRGLLSYTPVGAVVKVGADALKDMLSKYDITHMTIQAELTDATTGELMASTVLVREGKDGKALRMDFDVLQDQMNEFGARLRCRLDNARVTLDQKIDCRDPKARDARPPVIK